ncbi:MAG TPA: hypothetical protein VFV38_06030 [Ktedonobacteraceae bacterium]|nr:hypothetical protein [Ktedonobacteraceae bacterium]
MSDSDRLDFVAYLEPREATARWYEDILHQLWRYGLSFSPPSQKILNWQEELVYQPGRFIAGTNYENPEARPPLIQWAEDATRSGSGNLYAYDKHFRLFLTLQPQASQTSSNPDTPKTLGRIEISYDRVFLNPEHSSTEDLLPLYLQTWFAHIHWAEVCCTLFQPLYALSYQQDDIRYEESHAPGNADKASEDPLLKMLEKVHSKLLILVPSLEQTRLQYFSPHLLTVEEEQALVRQPDQFSEYLPTGGLLIIPRAEPFSYGFGLAHNLYNQSREIFERDDREENGEDEKERGHLLERGNALFDLYRRKLGSG